MQLAGIGFCAIRPCDNRADEIVARIALCAQHRDLLAHALKMPPRLFRDVVYYATWPAWQADGPVKIGTSSALGARLKNLSRGHKGRAVLLAVEPGSFSLERKRHRQFKAACLGSEIYTLTPQIRGHIKQLHQDWPLWQEIVGLDPQWFVPAA